MARLTKADILERTKLKTIEIEVPEWAGEDGEAPTVRLMAWSIRDAEKIVSTLAQSLRGEPAEDFAAQIVAVSLVDDDGQLMFGTEEGVEQICNMAPEGIVRVSNQALHFNKLGYWATDEEGQKIRKEKMAEAKDSTQQDEDPKN